MAFPPRFGMPPISPAAFVSAYPTVPMVSIVPATHYILPTIPNPVIAASATTTTKTPSRRRELPIDKPPVTTVFVGNIHERASNELIKGMLMKCGNIMQWKRIQGSNGKFQAFGFCEYDHPDSTLRALRLLHDWPLGDKRLVLKVDEKTKETLIEFINKRRQLYGKAPLQFDGDRVPGDEEMRKEDEVYRKALEGLVKEQGEELFEGSSAGRPSSQKSPTLSGKGGNLDIESLDRDKKEYIAKEIIMFREAHKDDKGIKPKLRHAPVDKETTEKTDDGAATKPGQAVDKGREGSVGSSTSKADHRVSSRRRRSSTSTHRSSSAGSASGRVRRHRKHGSSREASEARSGVIARHRTPKSRSRSKSRNSEEVEEQYERRRLERKVKEKEAAYEERLRKWEERERKREKEREKLRSKLKQSKKEEVKEAKKLKEFLEDYDDERDDPKYYKGKALELRRRDYDNELDADAQDRQKEKEELEEIRGNLLASGVPSAAEDMRQFDQTVALTVSAERRSPSWSSPRKNHDSEEGSVHSLGMGSTPLTTERKEAVLDPTTFVPADAGSGARPLGFTGLKLGVGSASTSSLRKVFKDENEDETEESAPARPLVPLEYTEEEKRAVEESRLSAEEKKKMIKSLIEKIPTSKDELFKYAIDWNYVDQSLIEKRLKPWVVKKIVEYIGEDEPSLVDFICQRVNEKASPQNILEDVSMVLDEEASVFVVKLWRLLIYEIEAKKIGIVKGESQG